MPEDTANTTPAPLTEDELREFLMWFFTQTGHAAHVATWRALNTPAPEASLTTRATTE